MITEQEFLGQILDDRWSLPRAIEFLRNHKEAWTVLTGLLQDRMITFVGPDGGAIPDWEMKAILRDRTERDDIEIQITDKGSKWAIG